MPGRSYTAGNGYRYGFNGKENDNEVKGDGNQQDYGMRIYDTRLGRFLSVDRLSNRYPWYTPYQFAGNKPIIAIDIDGLEEYFKNIIDALTFGFRIVAQKTNSTYTATIGIDAKGAIGAIAGASISGSAGLAVDAHSNFAFIATGQSWADLFASFGGLAWGTNGNKNEKGTVDKNATGMGGNIGIEFAGSWNTTHHIEGLAGNTKEVEFDLDLFEITLGYGNKDLTSIELAAGPGGGTPSFQITNTTTNVLGFTSENANQFINVLIEAEKVYNDNMGNNKRLPNQNIKKTFLCLSTNNGKMELIAQVISLNSEGSETILFSKTAMTLYWKNVNYIRTEEVIKTEDIEKTEDDE